jgi:hypothetical protein
LGRGFEHVVRQDYWMIPLLLLLLMMMMMIRNSHILNPLVVFILTVQHQFLVVTH